METIHSSLFDARFIIDGTPMELSPSRLLGLDSPLKDTEPVVDESLDIIPGGTQFDSSCIQEYLCSVRKAGEKKLSLPYAAEYSRLESALALIDSIWKEGHFVLDDLVFHVNLRWKDCGVGSMAALYRSVESFADFADSLDLAVAVDSLDTGDPAIGFDVRVADDRLAVGGKLIPDPDSWLIYVPFDTAEFHLGGSLFSQAVGVGGGQSPKMEDPDYFIDCFEVVRELVEDRVVIAGTTVGHGGLLPALDSMCTADYGMKVDITDLSRAYPGSDLVRLLFAEVPGVVIQIDDSDFDYVDAELLLQDVMYFPLGRPVPGTRSVGLVCNRKSGIGGILDSLLA